VFNWFDYFNLAEELLQHEGEAYQRSAVSRAYYAVYCNARNRLQLGGEYAPQEDETEHTHVWNTFRRGPERERIQIGELGHRLRERRNMVDYEDYIERLSDVVDDAMIRAHRIRAVLERL
jgi:hypothetical protein